MNGLNLNVVAGPCVPGWETGRRRLYCKAFAIKTLNLVGGASDVSRQNFVYFVEFGN
jgi:hypothetical protein